MFCYFGYGSNLDLTSLRAKGVEPRASRRGELPGWRLRFNVQHFFRHEGGVANIEPSNDPEDAVQGLVHWCDETALGPLDDAEACGYGYRRIRVPVRVDGAIVEALAYVGMPEFIDDHCRPSRRYRNILVRGAEAGGLEPEYVARLRAVPVHEPGEYPPFRHPPGDWPRFDAEQLAARPHCTALYGAVFDMRAARAQHAFLQRFFGGRDMTLFHLRRMDSSDGSETEAAIREGRLDLAQRTYLNAYLHEYDREYQYVGRFLHT